MNKQMITFHNGGVVDMNAVPVLAYGAFRDALLTAVRSGGRVTSIVALPQGRQVRVISVLAYDREGHIAVTSTDVDGHWLSMTSACTQMHLFERELAEQWGMHVDGHPWLKPVRLQGTDFFSVRGEEVHEVAVGPVHAGIIEPGHFRFQCHGEHVFHLEIALGYQYRGIERHLVGGPTVRTVPYMETLAGDTTIGHSMAYAHVCEALGDVDVSARALAIRAIALELERIANHTGDLGALANDIAYLPTASYCGRLRGDFLNMTAHICGNRFGRSLVRPGGVAVDLDEDRVRTLLARLEHAERDVHRAVSLLWDTASVIDRFERTGRIDRTSALDLGLVGPAARACGIEQDVRFDFPLGMYQFTQIPVATYTTGDVFARAYVRWLEIQRSIDFIREQLTMLPEGALQTNGTTLKAHSLAVALVEGWRGEICHVACTDNHGRFAAYKIVDPSFHNWMGLALSMRGEEISNFPLCNKSFNLSYCGHDL